MHGPTSAGSASAGSRIAIKFGGDKPRGGGSGSKHSTPSRPSKPAPPSSLGKRSRRDGLGGADSDAEEEEDQRLGRHEAITGFGVGGAETRRDDEEEESIRPSGHERKKRGEDGRHAGRRDGGKHSKGERTADADLRDTEPASKDSGMQFGLVRPTKKKEDPADEGKATPSPPPQPKNADEEALAALLGDGPLKTAPSLMTEDEAYSRDSRLAAAESTAEDYAKIPATDFGAMILKLNPADLEKGPRSKKAERRSNLVGLGAKGDDKELLGVWNHKAGKREGGGGGGRDSRPPKLGDYRRDREKEHERRRDDGRGESYKQERDREREETRRRHGGPNGHGHGHGHGHRDKDRDRR